MVLLTWLNLCFLVFVKFVLFPITIESMSILWRSLFPFFLKAFPFLMNFFVFMMLIQTIGLLRDLWCLSLSILGVSWIFKYPKMFKWIKYLLLICSYCQI